MLSERFPKISLPLNASQLRQLPRNAGYRYQAVGATTELSPEPQLLNALLKLPSIPDGDLTLPDRYQLRPCKPTDWEPLVELFADAFAETLPFSVLSATESRLLASECVSRTERGDDGPLLASASFVVSSVATSLPVAAILITLAPGGPLHDFTDIQWQALPPIDPVAAMWGRPHLTWVLVSPSHTRQRLGTLLLNASLCQLRQLGYRELSSTFLLDNLPSLLWHWRQGFQLADSVERAAHSP